MRALVLAIAIGLSACNPAITADTAATNSADAVVSATESAASLPRLAASEPDVFAILAEINTAWDYKRFVAAPTERHDSFSGTTARAAITPEGSVETYVRPDSGIWKVTARSGMGERCGTAWSKPAAVRAFVERIAGRSPKPEEITRIVSSMKVEGPIDPLDIDGVRINGSGGCVQQLSVKAITDGVDDPTAS